MKVPLANPSAEERPFATPAVGGRSVPLTRRLGFIDHDRVAEEQAHIGGEVLWYGVLAAEARAKARRAKGMLEGVEAQQKAQAREELSKRGVRATDDQVKGMACRTEPWREAYEQWVGAEAEADMVESAKYMLVQKQQALTALSSLVIQEVTARRPELAEAVARALRRS